MTNFLAVEVLGFVICDDALGVDLELFSEVIDVLNFVTSQPLSRHTMLDEDLSICLHLGSCCIKPFIGVKMLDNPN